MFKVGKGDTNTTLIKELIAIFIPLTLNMHLHARRNSSVDKYVFKKYMFNCFLIDGNFFHFGVFIVNFEQIQDKNSAH